MNILAKLLQDILCFVLWSAAYITIKIVFRRIEKRDVLVMRWKKVNTIKIIHYFGLHYLFCVLVSALVFVTDDVDASWR